MKQKFDKNGQTQKCQTSNAKHERLYLELSEEQETVAIAIANGASLAKAGKLVGVSRQRVWGWQKKNPTFAKTIETHKSKVHTELREQIVSQSNNQCVSYDNERKYPSLSSEQETVISGIANGLSFAKAGELVGASRQKVWSWLQDNYVFRNALENEKSQIHRELREQIASLVTSAFRVVANAIENGDERLAFAVFKEVGIKLLENRSNTEKEKQVEMLMQKIVEESQKVKDEAK